MIKSLDGLIKGFGILKQAVADFNMGMAEYIYLFWINEDFILRNRQCPFLNLKFTDKKFGYLKFHTFIPSAASVSESNLTLEC